MSGMSKGWTRRRILQTSLGTGLLGLSQSSRAMMSLTPFQSEGPFYPRPEHRFDDQDNDLVLIEHKAREAGGDILHLHGKVIDSTGAPVNGGVVEIWQCDVNGRYLHPGERSGSSERDDWFQGFGKNRTDESGQYRFRTIRPVAYPGRTPHIHVKVHLEDMPDALTTQMYVQDEPLNQRDGLYRRLSPAQQADLTVVLDTRDDGDLEAIFDLVIGRA